MSMTMVRPALGPALRRLAPASRSPGCGDTVKRMCSGGPNETNGNKNPTIVFVTIAVISMATYAYVVRGRTVLGYTPQETDRENAKLEKDNFA